MKLSTTQSTASKHSTNMLVGICKKCFCFELLSCLFYNKGRNCLHLLCLAVSTKNGPLTVILSYFEFVNFYKIERRKQYPLLLC